MSDQYFEEEEFQTQITGKIFSRILSLTKPHRKYLFGFIGAVLFTSIIDAVFTFISKQVIDQGILKSGPWGCHELPDPVWDPDPGAGSFGIRIYISGGYPG